MRLPLGKSTASSSGAYLRMNIRNGNIVTVIQPRQQNITPPPPGNDGDVPSATPLLVGIAIAGVLIGIAILLIALRRMRDNRANPKYIPTDFLKRRWVAWGNKKPASYRTSEHLEPISASSESLSNRSRTELTPQTTNRGINGHPAEAVSNTVGVDRNTSVRSVMTLPAYMAAADESERVLGREGERAGIDVVIEYPETVDEVEEQRRDEEMEALYQVRLARRTEAAEREELRRLRREARERNDSAALEELRQRARAGSGARANRTIEELREDHVRLRDRTRAVSSVSYADLGVAHHDGTRIRANSEESERPLLGDAASMASSRYHRRDRSASSVLSIDSDVTSVVQSRPRTGSRADSNLRQSSGAMSSPELIEAENDIGDGGFPTSSPPEYEDIALEDGQLPQGSPPEYRSPIATRASDIMLPTPRQITTQEDATGLGITAATPRERRGSGPRRGVGGTPQLPSLRLSTLPSIVVDTPTPIDRTVPNV